MKTKLLLVIMLCLVAPAVYAGGVTVKRQPGYGPPAGWVDRVSKRTQFSKVFEKDSIGSGRFMAVVSIEPMHYDSAGAWKNLKVESAPDTAAGFNLSVKTGRWSVDIDTTTGAFRFLRDAGNKKGSIRFTPAFSPATVPIEYDLSGRGIKATYTLNSGNRLAWGYQRTSALDTTGSLGKGKGRLKDALAQIKAEIQEFTALDANQKPVPLTATWTADSLIITLNTGGATYPIKVDPTITDTILSPNISGAWHRASNNAAGYDLARHAATFNHANSNDTRSGAGVYSYMDFFRTFLTFPLAGLSEAVSINDAFIIYKVRTGNQTAGACDTFYFNQGTWTGLPDSTKVDLFTGYSSDTTTGSFNVVEIATRDFTTGNATPTSTARTDTTALTTAGKSALLAKAQAGDSLRIMVMHDADVHNRPARALDGQVHQSLFYHAYNSNYFVLTVDYGTGNPPGLSTLADTALASAILVGEIDSTGGVNCTARGFQWWIDADTTTLSKSGSFGIGTFVDTVKALPLSATVNYRSFATNTNGTSYGSVQTFTTGAGGGSSLIVDGRTVNTSVR